MKIRDAVGKVHRIPGPLNLRIWLEEELGSSLIPSAYEGPRSVLTRASRDPYGQRQDAQLQVARGVY
ncbi:hypothetical protein HPP92_028964 [Vanilla planifolia]|uniref:Uncharacterized protein n=1 Tax=Vanilla planifolia TaxID=51239 RepID=A0A835U398_VANPL|nr:hypothetical protein HPP92_028964 [Vanilla planifolia]KAG0446200.1 hypothetical protein HPP92_028953 [Vanilla planifolia]